MFNKKNMSIQRKAVLVKKETEKNINETEHHIKDDKESTFSLRSNIVTIGSTHKGAGCTHIALAIAYKLSKRYKVALVERDSTSPLKGFDTVFNLKKGNLNSKKMDNLDVYFYGSNELINIIKEKYDYIVLDVGTLLNISDDKILANEDITEVYRADVKILVTQTREWQHKYLADFIKYDKELVEWIIVANLSSKKNFEKLKNTLKGVRSKVINVTYMEDVFDSSGLEDVLKNII